MVRFCVCELFIRVKFMRVCAGGCIDGKKCEPSSHYLFRLQFHHTPHKILRFAAALFGKTCSFCTDITNTTFVECAQKYTNHQNSNMTRIQLYVGNNTTGPSDLEEKAVKC